MSDSADLAADSHEIQINALISQRSAEPHLPIIGKCHNCKEPLPKGERFCDADCRDDFEKRQRMGVKS